MSTIQELSCQEIVELVTEYVEGTMDSELRGAFDAHLAKCDGCLVRVHVQRAAGERRDNRDPPSDERALDRLRPARVGIADEAELRHRYRLDTDLVAHQADRGRADRGAEGGVHLGERITHD